MGSPETVTGQLREFAAATGVGRVEFTFNDSALPYEYAVQSLELFGREVIPALSSLEPTVVPDPVK
jgi:hypothetical protein